MKTFNKIRGLPLVAGAVALGLMAATSATAYELGNDVALDSTVTLEYTVEAEDFTATYDLNLNYDISTELNAYASTEIDLVDLAENTSGDAGFSGVEVGLTFEPVSYTGLSAYVHANFDGDFDYQETTLGVAYEF